jgi:hypothetical protein
LLDSADAATVLRDRLDSCEWFAFISINGLGLPFLASIECRHYAGRASGDFEILAIPFVAGLGSIGIGLAKKSRLSVRELAKHFDEAGIPREAETVNKQASDVIVFGPTAEVMASVKRWLIGLISAETVEAR